MREFGRYVKTIVYTKSKKYTFGNGLHQRFNILARADSKPDEGTITIYNLAEESRNVVEEEFVGLELYAGRDDKAKMLFSGHVYNVDSKPTYPGYETIFYAGDGVKELSEQLYQKTFSKGTPVDLIMQDVAATFGLPTQIDPTATLGLVLASGLQLDAYAKDVMDHLAESYDLDWSIQFGTVVVGPKGETPKFLLSNIPLISPATGLIGSPTISYKKKKKNKKSKPAMTRSVEATAFLNPNLKPRHLFALKSTFPLVKANFLHSKTVPSTNADGIYWIDKVNHIGGNFAEVKEFYSKVTADAQ